MQSEYVPFLPSCRRVLGQPRDNLKEKSPKVFSSSPLTSNENVSFPNELSAIKGPPTVPATRGMTGRRKVTVSASSVVKGKKVKEPRNKKKKAKRKSDNRNYSSEEELREEDLSSSDSSSQSFKKKAKRPLLKQRRSLIKLDQDKKSKKDSQSLKMDPTNMIPWNSSAAGNKTLSGLGEAAVSAGRMWPRGSIALSNDRDDRTDNSSSFFNMTKRVRRVERTVEMKAQRSNESFDKTNPFSNVATGQSSHKESQRADDDVEGSMLRDRQIELSAHHDPTRGSPPWGTESSTGRGRFMSGRVRKFRH